ncbi:hypothetical protein Tco_1428618 [Tanacetum coccineum]
MGYMVLRRISQWYNVANIVLSQLLPLWSSQAKFGFPNVAFLAGSFSPLGACLELLSMAWSWVKRSERKKHEIRGGRGAWRDKKGCGREKLYRRICGVKSLSWSF